jgi:hypothetical protein
MFIFLGVTQSKTVSENGSQNKPLLEIDFVEVAGIFSHLYELPYLKKTRPTGV